MDFEHIDSPSCWCAPKLCQYQDDPEVMFVGGLIIWRPEEPTNYFVHYEMDLVDKPKKKPAKPYKGDWNAEEFAVAIDFMEIFA